MTENAELALCAAAFTDPRVHDDVKLTGASFADARLGAMWDTLAALHEQGTRPDPVTITEAARVEAVEPVPDDQPDLFEESA